MLALKGQAQNPTRASSPLFTHPGPTNPPATSLPDSALFYTPRRAASAWGWSAYTDPVMVVTNSAVASTDGTEAGSGGGAGASGTTGGRGGGGGGGAGGVRPGAHGRPGTSVGQRDGHGNKRKPAPPSTAPMARPSTSYNSGNGSGRGRAGSSAGEEEEGGGSARDSLWACVVCKRCNNPDVITVGWGGVRLWLE